MVAKFETTDYKAPTQKPKSMFDLSPRMKKQHKKTEKIFAGVDGIDETASSGATVLPKVWQPTAVCGTLALCTPLVWMGAKGMASDMQEGLNDAQHLKDSNVDLALKLLSHPNLPANIKTKIEAEFEKNNKKNATHLKILNKILEDKNSTSDKINKAFIALNIKVSNPEDSSEVVTALNAYHTQLKNKEKLKTALGFIKDCASCTDDTQKIADITAFIKGNTSIDVSTPINNQKELNKIVTKLCKNLNITPSSDRTLDSDIIQYDDKQKNISLSDNVFKTKLPNYLGNAAMLGMTLGTATAALKAGTEIMQQFGILPSIMPKATDGLEFGANGVFTLSQMAMIGYGLGQTYKGYTENQNLSKQKELLSKTPDSEQKTHAINHINQLQTYNTLSNTVYGVGMAAAEAGMIAGNLMGSSPLLLASSLGTLGFAITRIVAQSYQNALTGNDHDHEHNGNPIAMLDPRQLSETHLQDASNKVISGCNKAACTTEHGNFDLDINTVNKNYADNMANLNFIHEKIALAKNNDLNSHSILGIKQVLQHVTDNSFNFTDALLENAYAKEYVKDILIKELKKDENKNATDLATLNKEEKDEDTKALKTIFEANQGILYKPEYAKKILMPLLNDALNVLMQKRQHLYNNMIHIEKIKAEKQSPTNT